MPCIFLGSNPNLQFTTMGYFLPNGNLKKISLILDQKILLAFENSQMFASKF
jgi:hypothetical protein